MCTETLFLARQKSRCFSERMVQEFLHSGFLVQEGRCPSVQKALPSCISKGGVKKRPDSNPTIYGWGRIASRPLLIF